MMTKTTMPKDRKTSQDVANKGTVMVVPPPKKKRKTQKPVIGEKQKKKVEEETCFPVFNIKLQHVYLLSLCVESVLFDGDHLLLRVTNDHYYYVCVLHM